MIFGAIFGAICGAICGAIAGFVLELGASIFQMVTCSGTGPELGAIMGPVAIIGALIGAIVGVYMTNESEKVAAEQAEKERIHSKQVAYEQWLNTLRRCFQNITDNIYCNNDFEPGSLYEQVWELEKIRPEIRYENAFKQELGAHRDFLRECVNSVLPNMPGYYAIFMCLSAIRCLRASYKNEPRFDGAISALEELVKYAEKDSYYIKFKQYGDCILAAEESQYISRIDSRIEELEDKIWMMSEQAKDDLGEYFEKIAQFINVDYINLACELMWCNAIRKPFNQENFIRAKSFFGAYTVKSLVDDRYVEFSYADKCREDETSDDIICAEKVESILALIYAKNQIGGYNMVQQEEERIDTWLDNMVYLDNIQECFLLASGLAWMGLCKMERNILRQLVALEVNLPVELQDRLSFLEGGGTSNIKIYDVNETEGFLYDSSSVDWKADAYDMFFRKLELMHKRLNYSLMISKWTKTWPLAHGQKVTQEQIETAFEDLVDDFDGEVFVRKGKARAINLANIEHDNSFLFTFKGERNRCVTILFSSEKYGRNLNMTIITLFTPEIGLSNENLKKYALAIKDNIYVESFKESITQAVDEVIKVKQNVYEDVSYKKIFD